MSIEELARKSYTAFEAFNALAYFVPEVADRLKVLGLNRRQNYFCGRAAAMGVVPGELVAATFYNFNPTLAISATNSGWQLATPAAVMEEKLNGIEEALVRLLTASEGEPDLLGQGQVERALELTKKATANLAPAGRPLFAANQSWPWPTAPLQALWHGINLLREYRGDGHIAVLMAEGVGPVESLLLQIAFAPLMPLEVLIKSRAWDAETVQAAQESLADRDILREGKLTDQGRALRERIEQQTDRLDLAPFERLGETESQELLDLMRPMGRRIRERGGLS